MARRAKLSHSGEQRETARAHILDAIRSAGNIARIDIAQETRTSPATVTAITAELIAAGMIEEITPEAPPQAAKRGRPRVALKIRGDAHKIAGVKVSRRIVSAVVTALLVLVSVVVDVACESLVSTEPSLPIVGRPQAVTERSTAAAKAPRAGVQAKGSDMGAD